MCLSLFPGRRRESNFVEGYWKPMAAPPARARADYDYLIKLLLIGDSGMFPTLGFLFFEF